MALEAAYETPAGRQAAAAERLAARLEAERDRWLLWIPVFLGAGEPLIANMDLRALGYECVKHVHGVRAAAHIFLRKRP